MGDYVAAIKIVLRQTDQLERKVMELHQKREPGQEVHIPIDEFMSIARTLETYGVDPHPVKVRLLLWTHKWFGVVIRFFCGLFLGSQRQSIIFGNKSFGN